MVDLPRQRLFLDHGWNILFYTILLLIKVFYCILEATVFRTYKIYDKVADVWMTLEKLPNSLT